MKFLDKEVKLWYCSYLLSYFFGIRHTKISLISTFFSKNLLFLGQMSSRHIMVEDGFLSNHHKNSTSTSLGSRMNCTNSSASTSVTNKSPVGIRKNFHLSSSSSPITVTTTSDGRVERRLETCSYQETEMVSTVR